MKRAWIVGACLPALIVAPGAAAGTAPLPPITLTEAGADVQRRPFARWTPDYPIVNILVSTRAVRDEDTRPALRYWVQTGFYGFLDDGPEPLWRGDYPLIPGVYYTAVQGDGPFQGDLPWTPSVRFRVKARRGEWTGSDLPEALHPFCAPSSGGTEGRDFLHLRSRSRLRRAQLLQVASRPPRTSGRQVLRRLPERLEHLPARRRERAHQGPRQSPFRSRRDQSRQPVRRGLHDRPRALVGPPAIGACREVAGCLVVGGVVVPLPLRPTLPNHAHGCRDWTGAVECSVLLLQFLLRRRVGLPIAGDARVPLAHGWE